MKTLLVAPRHEDLTLSDAEVQRLVNALSAKIVIGQVDSTDVVDAIAEHQPEMIWFLSHGNWEGIILSNHVLLDGDMLAASVRGTPARLIVLNSCHSRAVAERIYAATGCHVVATRGDVLEQHAFVVAARFATLVAGGMDPHDAYVQAKTDDFLYIPENGGGVRVDDNLRRDVDGNSHRIGSNERLLSKLDAQGDDHERRLTRLETQMAMILARTTKQFDGWSWVLTLGFLVAAAMVFAFFGGAGWLWGG